jgi:methenyltetrahydromethanopterin cyclohydrolase
MTDVEPSSLFLVAYPTASIAGSVSAAARTVELATYRLSELGYDSADVLSGVGAAPLPPVAPMESTAMARGSDAIAYGGRVHWQVAEPFDEFESVVSTASEEYGRPLVQVYDEVGWDHAEVDRSVYAPAELTVDVVGGETHVVGDRDEAILAASFGL